MLKGGVSYRVKGQIHEHSTVYKTRIRSRKGRAGIPVTRFNRLM